MDDKRRFQRIDSALEVEYSPQGRSDSSYTVSKNISKGGICIPTLLSYPKENELVKLLIRTSDNKRHIPVTGKVRWIKRLDRPAILGQEVGIEFLDADKDNVERLLAQTR